MEINEANNWDEYQFEAIQRCSNPKERIVPVTGQAGTGKTTIIETVYRNLIDQGYKVAVCAPTGKAAQRIKEATGVQAATIHRLLEYPFPGEINEKTGKPYTSSEPKRDKFNPIDYDIVLADEYAMVNQELHRNLIDALPRGGCVRMFGDINQLPPIETNKILANKPSVFKVALEQFNGITLHNIYRQSEGDSISTNAAKILNGRMVRSEGNFQIAFTTKPVAVLQDFVLENLLEDKIKFNILENQIISPSNLTWVGTKKLNIVLQNIYIDTVAGWLNLPRHPWEKVKTRVNVGDKIIFTKNNYDLGLFNGETGIILDINHEYGDITAVFGDREVNIPPSQVIDTPKGVKEFDPRKDIDLAYVLTTHKTQGSEFKNVVYVMNSSIKNHLYRANFYTGVTRARDSVLVVTDQVSLSHSIRMIQSNFTKNMK